MVGRNRFWQTLIAVVATACLAACNGEDQNASASQPGASASAGDAVEIAKSNAYVMAANESSGTFARALARHADIVAPELAGDGAVENYAVVPVQDVTKIRTGLQEAIDLDGSVPELDGAARDYAAAIVAFEPVNNGLANYAQSNGFLADGGAKARAEDAAFVAALTKVADAETVFFDAITVRDQRLTQEAYDNAPEGSVERYRAGIVLRGKAAMRSVATVFTDPADGPARQEFTRELDAMAATVEDWDRAVRAEKPEGCPALQGSFNLVVANGRKAVQSAEAGRFDADSGTPVFVIEQEFNTLQQNFSMMIFQLNQPFSC